MQVTVTENHDALSQVGADLVAGVIAANPTATVLVATGSTPMSMYRELAARRQRGDFNASRLRVIQLAEYTGAEPVLHLYARRLGEPRRLGRHHAPAP